jgi:hypothetical protein
MEEILFGSIIVWVLGRIAKKKADAPAPGTIDLPRQGRTQQFPTRGSVNYPTTSGGSQGAAFNPNNQNSGQPGGGRPGQL